MSIYLDYNASNPVDHRVLDAMITAYKGYYGNPDSRTHDFGMNAHSTVEKARAQVAVLLDVKTDEVIFTSGATESNNIAILGLREYGIAHNRKHIVTTAIEHKAVLEPIKILESNGFEVDYVAPNSNGRIEVETLRNRIREDTLLVSVMHVNNETGIIQPVVELGEALSRTKTYFHIDAAQSCGKLRDQLMDAKYDLLSISAHKMYGPQGIGALIMRKRRYKMPPISPIFFGGQQERGFRPGTIPVALTVGLGTACDIAKAEYQANMNHYAEIKDQILNLLEQSKVPYQINGAPEYCLPNTINISFIGIDSEALMLASKQYCGVSNGSACTSSDYSHSHVLAAMGLGEERIESAIRISWGIHTKDIQEFKYFLESAKKLLQ